MTRQLDASEAPLGPMPARTCDAEPTAVHAWWSLTVILLLVLYTIADRPMLSLQVEPLRKELLLSDFQVGLVQGVSVALFAAFVAYPIAWLADRFDRRWVLVASLTVWCLALGLSALSRSFGELFVASALVGAGEAALVPIALAMIPALFGGEQRHLANSVLLVGGRLGVGAIIAICGWCIVAVDTWRHLLPAPLESMSTWRLSLMALALPGLVLVPLILTLPRPSGGQGSALTARQAAPPVWPFLRGQKMAMASFYLGIGLQSMAIGCVLNFAPVVAMRLMQASPAQAGNGMGAATFTATVMGFLIAQGANGRMTSRWGQRLPPLVMITAVACSFVPLVGILFSNTHTTLFIGSGAFLTLVMAGTLLYPTALQDMTPAPMRARLAAISVTVNIVGAASGPAFVGALSDGLKARSDGLLLSMVSVALVAVVLSFLLLLPLPSRYLATVTAARQTEAQFSPGQTVA